MAAYPVTSALHKDVLIIGGGVIGICAAYYLAKRGRDVILLEAGEICAGASYGNAGFILYSHIIPLAAPGVLGQGLKWLFDSTSPFYIKPRISLELASWLWRFRGACTDKKMRRSMGLLSGLTRESKRLYRELAGLENLGSGYEEKGHLTLYNTAKGFEGARKEAELMDDFGIETRLLDPAQVCAMAPTVRPDIIGGLYFPEDAHLIPDEFVTGLAEIVQGMGVDIRTSTEVLGFEVNAGRIRTVKSTRGNFRADEVILACGAWSPKLTRDLRLPLPIQSAKGYSVTYKRPETNVPLPMLLKEAAVAVTPMGEMLRFAGTLELAGLDLAINQRRIDAFLGNVGGYLAVPEDLELIEIWRGLRPCTPDGLPVIGRCKAFTNLILATGHATIGMGLGPVTGKLVSQIIDHEQTDVDIGELGVERFG